MQVVTLITSEYLSGIFSVNLHLGTYIKTKTGVHLTQTRCLWDWLSLWNLPLNMLVCFVVVIVVLFFYCTKA